MAPVTPGSAAAAFPASAFSQPARVLSCFLTQSVAVSPELGVGGVGVTPTAFKMASTMVDTTNPNAVRIDVMVNPC